MTVANQYTGRQEHFPLARHGRITVPVLIETSFRWYDLIITDRSDSSFLRHYAGHIENGLESLSDPHIGRSA